MNKTIPILLLLMLIATAILLLAISMLATVLSSPFLIAATIVALVALFGSVFSLFIENRAKNRGRQGTSMQIPRHRKAQARRLP
ncbi:MAG: hypothetical protein NWE93_11220 [Candidatus Bathyarchaeota archaeon]|nr:hypothetical protein [Candidatus Bathyarchaeota archaeon]